MAEIKFAIKYDKVNQNKILYEKDALIKAMKEYAERDYKLGVLGQPTTVETALKDVAFEIKNIEFDQGDESFVAEIEYMPTPNGDKLKEMLENPDQYKIVTYAHCDDIEEKEEMYVVKNMKILSVGVAHINSIA